MAKNTVETIFTAIDKFSSRVNKMAMASNKFGSASEAASVKANRSFNKLFPSIGSGVKEFAKFATAGLAFTAVLGGISSAFNIIADFEQSQASLAAASGKTLKENEALTNEALRLGAVTAKSATEVTGLQESLSRLGFKQGDVINMTEGVINGSIAMNSELARTADLTGAVINTFKGIESSDTATAIDQMTLATQRSALNFEKLETALPIVGGAASAAGLSFSETLSLLGKLSDAGIDASSSANALKNIFIRSKAEGDDYAEVIKRIEKNQDKLTASADRFGVRASVSSVILSENIEATAKLRNELEQLNNSEDAGSVARDAANKQLDTIRGSLTLLSSAYEGFILSTDDADGSLKQLIKTGIKVVTAMLTIANGSEASMESLKSMNPKVVSLAHNVLLLVKSAGKLAMFLFAIKLALVAWRTATIAANIVTGIQIALTNKSAFALRGNIIAVKAYRVATIISTVAQWLAVTAMTGFTAALGFASTAMASLNTIMLANPVGVIALAILALIAVTVVIIKKWDEWGAAAALLLGPFGILLNMVMSISRHWDSITSAFETGGFIAGIKAIGVAIIDSFLIPIQQVLKLVSSIPVISGLANSGLGQIDDIRAKLGIENNSETPVLNSSQSTEEQRIIREQTTNNNSILTINSPEGSVNERESNLSDNISLSSTLNFS